MSATASVSILQEIARRVMRERGLDPDFPAAALAELAGLDARIGSDEKLRDQRSLLWCSIDNDDSRDLDQLTVAERNEGGSTRVLVAIADVAHFVPQRSALDGHAEQNTTTVYTVAKIFPMLPERLSTDLTSLNFNEDRRAVVIAFDVDTDGAMTRPEVYAAVVRNRARLSYGPVALWLDGAGEMPTALAAVPGLDANLRLQDEAAARLRQSRHAHGALTFETIQTRAVFAGGALTDLAADKPNRAKKLIEDFMIAANGATAAFLAARKVPSLRRVVRTPKHWDRIVQIASEHGASLPPEPDSGALEKFLRRQKAADREHFAELSLTIIKLLGSGEYVVESPGAPAIGHFGLAVRDYAHSTAPNRRFPDLITQRLLLAALAGEPAPYSRADLERLAEHCTEQEDDARKVERQVAKSAAALLLAGRIGEEFDALVTGASEKGTWVRLFRPSVEGRLAQGFAGYEVGQRLRVRLLHADVERGFLDFAAIQRR